MGNWYIKTFGFLPILGVVLTAISMAPTGIGVACWLAGAAVFHYAIYRQSRPDAADKEHEIY